MPPEADSPLVDHIGLALVRAGAAWKQRYSAAMVAAGYPFYGEARAALLQHIGPQGLSQATLVRRAGLSKQAVQQHLQMLEADGVLTRQDDPSDARRKLVVFTEAGHEMRRCANRVKLQLEAELQREIGPEAFAALDQALKALLMTWQD